MSRERRAQVEAGEGTLIDALGPKERPGFSTLAEAERGPGWLLEVEPGAGGQRLDRFLSTRIPRLSRARAARLRAQDLARPERWLRKAHLVREGQRLWVPRPAPKREKSATPLSPPSLIANEGALLILDKPAGWTAHPTAAHYEEAITTWLQRQGFPHEPAHRLDLETSGVLLCAVGTLLGELRAAFRERRVEKRYLAVVEGRPPLERWEVDCPLGFDQESAVRIKMGRGELPAESRFRLCRSEGKRSLIEAEPLSGRQHQLRVHLSLSGFPIVGDKLYGPSEQYFLESLEGPLSEASITALGHHRQALHAWRVSFRAQNTHYTFESPWPESLEALMSTEDELQSVGYP